MSSVNGLLCSVSGFRFQIWGSGFGVDVYFALSFVQSWVFRVSTFGGSGFSVSVYYPGIGV